MNLRTTERMVVFEHPFRLAAVEGEIPAGTYRLIIDEEEVPGISFLAYRRAATMLQLPALSAPSTFSERIEIDPTEFEAALMRDRDLVV